jgi:predicted Fe-Mo cluster-binding NifX family protein
MKVLICAFGTDDGEYFTNRHFGDSNKFDIYEISNESVSFIKQIENNSIEEKIHSDPKKAGSISKILKSQGVQIVFSKQFGPNIKRIRKNFVCVRVLNEDIKSIVKMAIDNIDMIMQMWESGEERGFITQVDDHFKIVKL